jgi:flavin-dependent dehydrogenase
MAVVRDPDLLVIGGGPAGLATAIEAQLAGLETLVVDRRKPPIDVACGEGLMPIGVERLSRLGVDVSDAEHAVFRGIRYLDGGLAAEARFKRSFGLGVRRTVLHRALHRRAVDVGVEFRWGVTARAIRPGGVETDTGPVCARWLVAADGRLSRLRKWAGLEGRAPKLKRFGVRRHYATVPWSDVVEVYWSDHVEAYVTPVGPEQVGVAVLSSEPPIAFDHFMKRFPVLRARLEGAPVASRDRGAGPFGQRPTAVTRDNIALVGDASGSLDPITGEGLSIALAQAQALIQCLVHERIEDYAGLHRRIARAPKLLTYLLLCAERHPRLRRTMIRVLASHPSVFGTLVDIAASGPTAAVTPKTKNSTAGDAHCTLGSRSS